jgi:hypothetical protein
MILMIMKSQNKITTHLLDLSPVLSRLLSHIYYVEIYYYFVITKSPTT